MQYTMGSSRKPTLLELELRLDDTLELRLDDVDDEPSRRRMLFVFGFCG
jgi:hypothetical protein